MIDDMLAQASPPPVDGPILAAVAPHAGYPYSGPVAAWTFAALKGHKYSRVVVIAPSHYVGFDFTSVYDGDAYATPLGTIPVDKEFARQLTKMSSTIQLSEQGHTPTSAGGEHAIEVQLPWLQKVLGNFELVPIVMGDQSYESSRALGVALAKMIQDERKSPTRPATRSFWPAPISLTITPTTTPRRSITRRSTRLRHGTTSACRATFSRAYGRPAAARPLWPQ